MDGSFCWPICILKGAISVLDSSNFGNVAMYAGSSLLFEDKRPVMRIEWALITVL